MATTNSALIAKFLTALRASVRRAGRPNPTVEIDGFHFRLSDVQKREKVDYIPDARDHLDDNDHLILDAKMLKRVKKGWRITYRDTDAFVFVFTDKQLNTITVFDDDRDKDVIAETNCPQVHYIVRVYRNGDVGIGCQRRTVEQWREQGPGMIKGRFMGAQKTFANEALAAMLPIIPEIIKAAGKPKKVEPTPTTKAQLLAIPPKKKPAAKKK